MVTILILVVLLPEVGEIVELRLHFLTFFVCVLILCVCVQSNNICEVSVYCCRLQDGLGTRIVSRNDGESLSARLPSPCSLGDMVVYYECIPF
jgi:hypothetical protein